MRLCSIDGCENLHNSRGYCLKHYKLKWHNREFDGIPECSIDGCKYGVASKGYCKTHYTAAKTSGEFKIDKKCSVNGCDNNHNSRGYCKSHYNLAIRAGEFSDMKKCVISNCEISHFAKGYCESHYGILKNYNILPERYEEMILEQSGLCAICNNPPPGTHKNNQKLYVDHDHNTSAVRGLLCHYCNSLLGHAMDNINILESSINYLRRYDV